MHQEEFWFGVFWAMAARYGWDRAMQNQDPTEAAQLVAGAATLLWGWSSLVYKLTDLGPGLLVAVVVFWVSSRVTLFCWMRTRLRPSKPG
jgi:hypothetical protein